MAQVNDVDSRELLAAATRLRNLSGHFPSPERERVEKLPAS